jgi:hypothetical protein
MSVTIPTPSIPVPRPLDQLQSEIDNFNLSHPVGTSVKFWPGPRQDKIPQLGQTIAEAELLGGHTPVVCIKGYGPIRLTHVEPIPRAQTPE